MDTDSNGSCSAICSICYDDLKPFVSELQAVSVCGHVFHELCLQQWFECSSTRKQTCPVCKQNCSGNKTFRLFFQSTGDTVDSTQSKHLSGHGENPEALYREVKRLEAKVSGLNSTVERQVKDLKNLSHELNQCKELLEKEMALKDDALKQKAAIQQLLLRRSQELDKSNIEGLRLHERNMALAKELAALKLVTDLDLNENEVLKLASLGNDSNSKDTVDILRKSLVIRNKNYKDLMAKCNLLGRGEAIYSRKLERAKQKISILKIRVQELETAAEAKENEILRGLRTSKNNSLREATQSYNSSIPTSTVKKLCVEDHLGRLPRSQTGNLGKNSHSPENNKPENVVASNKVDASFILIYEDSPERPVGDQGHPVFNFNRITETAFKQNAVSSGPEKFCKGNEGAMTRDVSTSPIRTSNDCNTPADEDVMILGGSAHGDPVLNIRKEASLQPPNTTPGHICFSGGLLGPDGTSRYLGKWCKRVGQNSISGTMQRSNISSGDLIAVGPDGRGGRVKALRSPIQSLSNNQENSAKRLKSGSKTSASPSQGCLQIEHFFQKANC